MINNRVTTKDLWNLSDKIMKKMEDIEEKHDEQLKTICQRTSSLEIWRVSIMAKVTLGIGIVSLAFTCFWQWVLKRWVNN